MKYVYLQNIDELKLLLEVAPSAPEPNPWRIYGYNNGMHLFPTIFVITGGLFYHIPIREILINSRRRQKYAKWIEKAVSIEEYQYEISE